MSKKFRRLLSLTFVLSLLLSLAAPAFAEGSISAEDFADPFEVVEGAGNAGSISVADEAASSDAPQIALAEGEESTPAASGEREIFVSAKGDDMDDGSREHPLASLAAAADLANDAAESTVYVILLSDLTVTKTARFNGKDVVLMSEEGTALVTRGGNFEPAYDELRHAYNPAMIELGEMKTEEPKKTTLSLDNVVLDDAGLHEGADFLAQSTDPNGDVNNLDRVQDAIVALYGDSSLTLNPGSELRNFGGLSAIRALGSGIVTVEDYSFIRDTAAIAAPEGLRAILAEGAEVRIGTYAKVIERVLAAEETEEPAEEAEEPVEEAEEPVEEAEEPVEETEEPAEEAEEPDEPEETKES